MQKASNEMKNVFSGVNVSYEDLRGIIYKRRCCSTKVVNVFVDVSESEC